jgi:hypothetical protein
VVDEEEITEKSFFYLKGNLRGEKILEEVK